MSTLTLCPACSRLVGVGEDGRLAGHVNQTVAVAGRRRKGTGSRQQRKCPASGQAAHTKWSGL